MNKSGTAEIQPFVSIHKYRVGRFFCGKFLLLKIKNINNDNSLLSNLEMIKNLKALLINGNISLLDYENFIEVEGLSFEFKKESKL